MEEIVRMSAASNISLKCIEISADCLVLCKKDFYEKITEEDEYGDNIVVRSLEKAMDGNDKDAKSIHSEYLKNTVYGVVPVVISANIIPEVESIQPLGNYSSYEKKFINRFALGKEKLFYVEYDKFIEALDKLGYMITSAFDIDTGFEDYESQTKSTLFDNFHYDGYDMAAFLIVKADFTKTKNNNKL